MSERIIFNKYCIHNTVILNQQHQQTFSIAKTMLSFRFTKSHIPVFRYYLPTCFILIYFISLQLNSKNMTTDFGPKDDHAGHLFRWRNDPQRTRFTPSSRRKTRRRWITSRSSEVKRSLDETTCCSFSSTGREWATISGECLHVLFIRWTKTDEQGRSLILFPCQRPLRLRAAVVETKRTTRRKELFHISTSIFWSNKF